MKRILMVLPLVALALSACGGGGSSIPHAAAGGTAGSSSLSSTPGSATVSVAMRIPGATTSSSVRRAAYVSAGTASVKLAVAVGSNAPVSQTFSVTPGSGSCPTTSGTTTCSFALQVPTTAPSASATLTVTTYDAASPTPNVLATGSVPFTLDASGTNAVNVTLGGVVNTLAVSINPTSVTAGTASSVAVNVVASDPDGYAIIGSYVSSTGGTATVSLASSDTNAPVTPASITSSSTSVSLAYNGASSSGTTATVTATSGSLSAKAALVYLASGGTTVYFVLGNGTAVAVAPNSSNGPALRTLNLSATYNSTSGIAVTPNGTVYVQVGATKIDVFAPGATNTGPEYTITDTNFSGSSPIRSIAPIKSGPYVNGVLVGGGDSSGSELDIFSATNAGSGGTFTPDVAYAVPVFGPIVSVVQSPAINAYVWAISNEGGQPIVQGIVGTPSGSSNPFQQYSSTAINSTNFSSYPVFWDQANATNMVMAADETDHLFFTIPDASEVTPFALDLNGQAVIEGYNDHCGCFSYASENGGTNGYPFGIGNGEPSQMTFDTSGNLFALQGSNYNEYLRASIVSTISAAGGDSGPTLSSSSSTSYSSQTIRGATVGP